MKVIIPSRGRARTIRGYQHWPGQELCIVVDTAEDAVAYAANPDLAGATIVQREERTPGIGAVRQWAMDHLAEQGEWVLFCDDNVRAIRAVTPEHYGKESLPVKEGPSAYWRGVYETICEPNRFLGEIVPEVLARAMEIGAYYAAFGSTGNAYFRATKWREVGFAWVALSLVRVERDLRIDQRYQNMDDYQFTAEQLLRHGAVLINNYVWADKRFYEAGGRGGKTGRLEAKKQDVAMLLQDYPGLFRMAPERANSIEGAEVRMRYHDRMAIERWRAGLGIAWRQPAR